MNRNGRTDNAASPFLARFFAAEIRAWRGEARLAQVFWLYGVAVSCALLALHATTVYLREPVAEQVLLACSGLYTVWILGAIWRCAGASDTIWGTLARFLTIAWAANVGFVLLFRQFDLLARFFSAAPPG